MTRTFWLSFCDGDRPAGEQFLGVCLVDVDETEALFAHTLLRYKQKLPNAIARRNKWLAAAVSKTWRIGCNPGGGIAGFDITDCPHPEKLAAAPRDILLSRQDLEELDLI